MKCIIVSQNPTLNWLHGMKEEAGGWKQFGMISSDVRVVPWWCCLKGGEEGEGPTACLRPLLLCSSLILRPHTAAERQPERPVAYKKYWSGSKKRINETKSELCEIMNWPASSFTYLLRSNYLKILPSVNLERQRSNNLTTSGDSKRERESNPCAEWRVWGKKIK